MQYFYDGESYKVVRITGPKHNILAISFGKEKNEIEVVNLEKPSHLAQKENSNDVKNQVILGISEINMELSTNYIIKKIQFIGSDSPSDTVYIELSKLIVKRIESGESFTKI